VSGLSFDLLVALARHAPNVVDRDALAAEVWKQPAVTDETIMQRVALLRRALGDDAGEPTYVRSVRGRGYTLVPTPEPLGEPTRRLRAARIAAAVAALGVATLAAFLALDRGETVARPVRTGPLTADELAAQADAFLARHRDADNELAIDLYGRSLALAPDHPRSLVGLSLALSQRVSKFNRPPDNAERALELAERSLAIAPRSARAHYARAFALDSRGRVGGALDAYLRAAALDPSNVVPRADAAYLQLVGGDLAAALATSLEVLRSGARLHYLEVQIGWSLALLGHQDAAAVWLQRSLDLWPDSLFAGSTFATFRLHQGHLAEAERLALAALDLGVERAELPTLLGHVALLRGDREEAARRYREAEELSARVDSASVRLLLLGPERPGARARYRELASDLAKGLAEGDEWPGTAVNLMLLHAGFGSPDEALAALDTAIDLGYRESAWLMLDPALAALREHAGFVERIERIALEIEGERAALAASPEVTAAFVEPSASTG
jgi:tetratricopeptide (TPR) repeat protein